MSVDAVIKVVKNEPDGNGGKALKCVFDSALFRLKALMCDDDAMTRFSYSATPEELEKILNEEADPDDGFSSYVSWKVFNTRTWEIGNVCEFLTNKTEQLREKKYRYENMKTGLDYAKLSFEEKENVEMENPKEELAEAEEELFAVQFLADLADAFYDSDPVYFCMALM